MIKLWKKKTLNKVLLYLDLISHLQQAQNNILVILDMPNNQLPPLCHIYFD